MHGSPFERTLIAEPIWGCFFLWAYIAGATFVYQGQFGLNANVFGIAFGVTGIAVMVGAIVTGRTGRRVGANRLAIAGTIIIVGRSALVLLMAATGVGLWGVVVCIAIALFGVGSLNRH